MPPISELIPNASQLEGFATQQDQAVEQETFEQKTARLEHELLELLRHFYAFQKLDYNNDLDGWQAAYEKVASYEGVLVEALHHEGTCESTIGILEEMKDDPFVRYFVKSLVANQTSFVAERALALETRDDYLLAKLFYDTAEQIELNQDPQFSEALEDVNVSLLDRAKKDWQILNKGFEFHHSIFKFGSEEDSSKMFSLLSEKFETEPGSRNLIFGMLNSEDVEVRIQGKMLVSRSQRQHGLDPFEMTRAWRYSTIEENQEYSVASNWKTMCELDDDEPWAAAKLYQDFGIKHYDRYPEHMLVRQNWEKEFRFGPHGVLIYPEADHNGAYYQQKPALEHLSNDLKDTHAIRIYEQSDRLGIASTLIKVYKKYGPISFIILAGHGNPASIDFGHLKTKFHKITDEEGNTEYTEEGERIQSHSIRLHDIQRLNSQFAQKILAPNAVVILVSCSTGEKEAIGQEISKYGFEVIAPSEDTNLNDIRAYPKEDGSIDFKVEYWKPEHAQTFINGVNKTAQ